MKCITVSGAHICLPYHVLLLSIINPSMQFDEWLAGFLNIVKLCSIHRFNITMQSGLTGTYCTCCCVYTLFSIM